MMNKYKI